MPSSAGDFSVTAAMALKWTRLVSDQPRKAGGGVQEHEDKEHGEYMVTPIFGIGPELEKTEDQPVDCKKCDPHHFKLDELTNSWSRRWFQDFLCEILPVTIAIMIETDSPWFTPHTLDTIDLNGCIHRKYCQLNSLDPNFIWLDQICPCTYLSIHEKHVYSFHIWDDPIEPAAICLDGRMVQPWKNRWPMPLLWSDFREYMTVICRTKCL